MAPHPSTAERLNASRELGRLIAGLRVGKTRRIGKDAFVPLLADREPPFLDVALLEEELREGRTILREISDDGDVNRIRVRHEGPRMLLLVDGEQIVGAKQNRVFNASFLVAPGSEVEVPVSCVERGRWRYTSDTFGASGQTLTGVARSRKVSRVTDSIFSGLGYDARQGEVWGDVDEYLEHSQVVSVTSALDDGLAARATKSRRTLSQLAPEPLQVGMALVRDGRFVLADLFGTAELYARAWRKVLSGMIADAGGDGRAPAGARRAVAHVLDSLAEASVERRDDAPGCGTTLHGRATGVAVSAVVQAERLVHLVMAAA